MDLIKKSWFSLLEENSKLDNTKKFFQNEEKKQKKKIRPKKGKFKVKQIECIRDSLTHTFPFLRHSLKMNTENSFITLHWCYKKALRSFPAIMEPVLKQLFIQGSTGRNIPKSHTPLLKNLLNQFCFHTFYRPENLENILLFAYSSFSEKSCIKLKKNQLEECLFSLKLHNVDV